MAKINLLPWREQLRKERQNQFYLMLGAGVVVAALLSAGWHFYEADRIAFQNKRNVVLEKEIKEVEAKIAEIKALEETKAKLLARMEVIQNLQKSRPLIVHLFDELPRRLPEGTYFNSVKQQGSIVAINGLAQSNTRVSTLMRNVDASSWLGNPVLKIIETKSGDNNFAPGAFSLTVQQVIKRADGTIEQPTTEDKGKKAKKPQPQKKKG